MFGLLIILGLIMILLPILYEEVYKKRGPDKYFPCWRDCSSFVFGCGVGIFILCGLVSFFAYTINLSRLSQMEAFYDINAQNYATTINTTATYLSEERIANALIQGSIEKLGYAEVIGQAVIDYRDNIVIYNSELIRFRRLDSNFITSTLYPRPPDRLTPLILQ